VWGEDELKEELLFYGFSSVETFDAKYWNFDFENYFPKDHMELYHGMNIPNLGIIGIK